jgi:subtilisin-like proprotein convertase family protein
MKLLISLCALFPLAASAATTWSNTWTVTTVIPDNDDVGYTNSQMISGAGLTEIQSVAVSLNFSGGWNGDLYAYLIHDTGFAVLLNRIGRNSTETDGSATVGLAITLIDDAYSDVHTVVPTSGGLLAGTFQPDGRIADPLLVMDTDPRPAMLSSFDGIDANGIWTLFVADQSAGFTSTLESWSLTVTAVPEPSMLLLGGLGFTILLRRKR